MLGGTDNYEVDRRSADGLEDMMPGTYALARNNRRYLERAVHYLAGECGIRQFIDHGSGLPTQNNVHQVAHPDTRRLIDFDEPVVALYISFLHCVPDARDPYGVVRQMIDRLAPGSYLAISHLTSDDPQVREKITRAGLEDTGGRWGRVRSREEVADFFDGLELVPPGLVKVNEWHPDGREEEDSPDWFEYGGVARKP